MPSFAVILAAAGNSRRFGDAGGKKPFVSLLGEPVWFHSAKKFASRDDVKQLVVVVGADDQKQFEHAHAKLLALLDATVVVGGKERMDSVANGLAAVRGDIEFVAIHDGARPCVSIALIESVFDAAAGKGCVIPANPVSSTVKRSDDGGKTVAQTVDRDKLFLAQTPQVFSRTVISHLFKQYRESDSACDVTDEAQLAEHFGVIVHLVAGCPLNIKLTNAVDLQIAQAYLEVNDGVRFDASVYQGTRLA